jgi:hypothetical protein
MSQPDADSRELDESKIVCGVLLVSGCDGAEMLELVEEALHEVPIAHRKGLKTGGSVLWAIGLMLAHAPWAVSVSRSALLS